MSRRKADGKGRLGGRSKGTPNKINAEIKVAFSSLLNDYIARGDNKQKGFKFSLEEDLAGMKPEDRAKLITGLAPYIIPKQQALSIEDQTQLEVDALTLWMEEAPDDAIEGIATKVLELQSKRKIMLNN